MRKLKILFLSVVMVFLLVACGGGQETPTGVAETETVLRDRTGEFELPVQTQLMIGTFLLEDTDIEVTAEQAPELIPLWKGLQALLTSDTAAEAEVDAVVNQIQKAMTSDQLHAIQELELTPESMATLMEELDLEFGAGFPGADGDGRPEGVPEGGFTAGGFPGGGVPGGRPGGQGGGPGSQGFDQDLSPEQIATLQAAREERGGFRNRASSFLITPIIELLEGKVE